MIRLACVLSFLLAAAATLCSAAGGPGRFPTNEDLRHFRALNAPRLSPDGRQVLLQIADSTADQSQEMYRALRQMGVPVEMVQYPRDNHGPLAVGLLGRPSREPWHGFDARQRLLPISAKSAGPGARAIARKIREK